MSPVTSAVLGILFVGIGLASAFLMFHLWGYPFDKATRTSAAPKSLMLAHRLSAYAASKAAVACLTASIAEELKDAGILVNAVVPSIVDTPANRKAMPKADVSRWPTPAELAKTILFLASPDNTLTQGALVPVYGRA